MELTKLSKSELLVKCGELGITKCKSKTKGKLIEVINKKQNENAISSQLIEVFTEQDNIKMDTPLYNNENNVDLQQTNIYTLIDLFCGTGAFSYAFHQTNKVNTIFANDMLDSSEDIFNLNYNIKLTKQSLIDIPDNDIPKSDILTAGFPCQPFSIAGMQKGFDDDRSNVFWKILSIIKNNNPGIVILENVKNLQSHDNGNTFKIIIENLEKLDYYVKYSILNTSKITGIPQNMFDNFNFDFPEIKLKTISTFLEKDIPDKYYYNNSTIIYDELQKNVVKHISSNTIYQYRRYYVRENKNNVCPTLTANMGGGGHNVPIILDDKGIRKLTPRECFNLQGFPNEYKLPSISTNKLYSLSGNAVSIPVVALIADKLIN